MIIRDIFGNFALIHMVGRDGTDEGSQDLVSLRNKKNYHHILPII